MEGQKITMRQIALEKALEAHRGQSAKPEDILVTAESFLTFLNKQ